MRTKLTLMTVALIIMGSISSCDEELLKKTPNVDTDRTGASVADYSEEVKFSTTKSSMEGAVYEILPGPAAIDPSKNPTPFSNNTRNTTGSYEFTAVDLNEEDAADSKDSLRDVHIQFTGNDGRSYQIDEIDIIHKPKGAGDHTFFGGVGMNKVMHGNTGIGTPLMPKIVVIHYPLGFNRSQGCQYR